MMSEEDVRRVVRAVLDEERSSRTEITDDVVLKAVATILTSFGMDERDQIEIRRDFEHLRKWRTSVEQAQSITFKFVITTIAGGVLGAIWLGLKTMLAVSGKGGG